MFKKQYSMSLNEDGNISYSHRQCLTPKQRETACKNLNVTSSDEVEEVRQIALNAERKVNSTIPAEATVDNPCVLKSYVDAHTENTTIHVTENDKSSWNGKLSDAPIDGKMYGRKNGYWTEVENGNTFTYVVYNTTPTSDVAVAVLAGKTLRMVDDSYDNITIYADVYTITESGIKFVAIVDNGTDEYISEFTCNWEENTWSKTTRTSPLEAPIDGKMYGRKNGSWTDIGITSIQFVTELPSSPSSTTLYLIKE